MEISEKSRIWIYQSDRVFTDKEAANIQQQLDQFTSQWLAHGNRLAALGEIRHNRFIIISVDEQVAGATGCSIDKSVKLMQDFEKQFNIKLFDRFHIAYREGENIKSCSREEFEKLIETCKVNAETIVFNNLVSERKELQSKWEVAMKDSWHARVFQLDQV